MAEKFATTSAEQYLRASGAPPGTPVELLARANLAQTIGPALGTRPVTVVSSDQIGGANFNWLQIGARPSEGLYGGIIIREIHNADAARLELEAHEWASPITQQGAGLLGAPNLGGRVFEEIVAPSSLMGVTYETWNAPALVGAEREVKLQIGSQSTVRVDWFIPNGRVLRLRPQAVATDFVATITVELVPFQAPDL